MHDRPTLAVGRFQVMATLQAARAVALGLPRDSALSWGLNRAIFYAAAKRGFKGSSGPITVSSKGHGKPASAPGEYYLGDELAYKEDRDDKLLFVIGGKPQTPADFDRQIASRFGGKFEEAWEQAVYYVRQFDDATLGSGEGFFASVYRPKRDEFAAKWTEMAGDSKPARKRSR